MHDEIELTGTRLCQGHLTLDAARYGGGIALTNYLIASDDLTEGRLVEIGKGLDSFLPYTVGIWCFIARADPGIRRLFAASAIG